jgi:hypothetical protein
LGGKIILPVCGPAGPPHEINLEDDKHILGQLDGKDIKGKLLIIVTGFIGVVLPEFGS